MSEDDSRARAGLPRPMARGRVRTGLPRSAACALARAGLPRSAVYGRAGAGLPRPMACGRALGCASPWRTTRSSALVAAPPSMAPPRRRRRPPAIGRGRPAPGRAVLVGAVGAMLLVLAAGCARKGPPSGGPPDLVPPQVVSSEPDSGKARVRVDAPLSVTFSEGMEPRSTGEAVSLAPRVDVRQRRWNGRELTLLLEGPMRANQTYTLFVGPSARDRHGNALSSGRTVVFSTADSFPPGVLEGRIEARGFDVAGTYLWCYRDGRSPDSTARDFDALGLADAQGFFRIPGLPVPGSYRLWAFADLNHNRSFEPEKDVLAPVDTTLELTAAHAVARDLTVRVVDPRAPAHLRGIVVDPTGDTLGVFRVIAIAEEDSTRRVLAEPDGKGAFDLKLEPGKWQVRAWRDEDGNRGWRMDQEPASELEHVVLGPAQEMLKVRLVLRRWGGGGP